MLKFQQKIKFFKFFKKTKPWRKSKAFCFGLIYLIP